MFRFVIVTVTLLLIVAVFWLFEEDIPAEEVDARYSNEESEFLETGDGARIHYRDQGNPDGLPLVLVHGSNASLHTWEPWVDELGDTYRIVTIDMPGHGLTGQVPDGDYSPEAMVDTVHTVTEHLGLPPFVLGGNSMGGGVTWRYALAHPDEVRAMLLLNSSPPRHWPREPEPGDEEDGALAFELLRNDAFRTVAQYMDPEPLIAQGLRAAYHDDSQVTEDVIARYRAMSLREGSRAATMARFGQYGQGDETAPPDLSRLTQPTLVMWGRHDALIPVSVAGQFDQALPNAEVVIYDDLGHVPMEEAPARSAADVHEFLEKTL